jgi:hypothetical protein
VTKADADNGQELIVQLFWISITQAENSADGPANTDFQKGMQLHLKQGLKRIPVGQPIEFTRGEHMAAILSLCIFTSTLLQETDKYLQSVGQLAEVAPE